MLPEYVGSVRDCVVALDACAPTGLPVFLGVRHVTAEGDMQFGETFEQLVEAIGDRRVDAILVMCSMPEPTTVALAKLRDAFEGPAGAYAHIGYDAVPEEQRRPGQPWHVLEAPDYPPERFAGFGRQWLDLGAQVIGGCCATTPDHIAAHCADCSDATGFEVRDVTALDPKPRRLHTALTGSRLGERTPQAATRLPDIAGTGCDHDVVRRDWLLGRQIRRRIAVHT